MRLTEAEEEIAREARAGVGAKPRMDECGGRSSCRRSRRDIGRSGKRVVCG